VFTGSSMSMASVAASASSHVTVDAVAGTTYAIQVDGSTNDHREFTLQWAPPCNGRTATIVGAGTIEGTAGNDVIVGSDDGDEIEGLGGNDTSCARGGNELIEGGTGDDVVFAGGGSDTMIEDASANGADDLRGQGGNDTVD